MEERAQGDQRVLSYGLERLVDDCALMSIFLEPNSLCARTGSTVEVFEVMDVHGRPRLLLGILELLRMDTSTQTNVE